MMARSHVIIGAASWIAYSTFTGAPLNFLLVVVSAFSSLLPDMDHPKSVFGSLIKPVSTIISKIFGHRGITHSLIAVAAIAFVLSSYSGMGVSLVSAIAIGYLSHLMADFMTPAGVPLLYPLKNKFNSIITVRTGGMGETFIVASVVVLTFMHLLMPATSYMTVFNHLGNMVSNITT